jgi:hypothetical protein
MLSLLTSTIAGTRWHELASYGFAEYKAEFGKAYATVEEEAQREANFLQRLKAIKAHNADPTQTYKRGVNPFTDRTLDELRPLHGLDRALLFSERAQEPVESMTKPWKANEYPAGVDWRRRGAVTPVKNQGQCGSCWTVTDASLKLSRLFAPIALHTSSHPRVPSCALVCSRVLSYVRVRVRVLSCARAFAVRLDRDRRVSLVPQDGRAAGALRAVYPRLHTQSSGLRWLGRLRRRHSQARLRAARRAGRDAERMDLPVRKRHRQCRHLPRAAPRLVSREAARRSGGQGGQRHRPRLAAVELV